MALGSLKQSLAGAFDGSGLNALLLGAQARLWRPHARAVNYHDVPPARADDFEAQLRFYAEHFEPVDLEGLRSLLGGRWSHARPGLVISFDDGLRSHADVVAPLLEKYGFCGWFMVPVDFVDVPAAEQASWAREHSILFTPDAFDDPRIALDWDDVRRLDARHVVACHTRGHQRLHADLTAEELQREIPDAKRILEERLGHEVPVFAWVGGEEGSYSRAAAAAIRDAGFDLCFMTNNAAIRPGGDPLQLQRSNIEADFPLPLVRFTLSGFYDVMYWPKRGRVGRMVAGA